MVLSWPPACRAEARVGAGGPGERSRAGAGRSRAGPGPGGPVPPACPGGLPGRLASGAGTSPPALAPHLRRWHLTRP
ncbi:MAG TPA: hypothetical protein VK280_23460, partial [Streptosporangiaceae bacterium]|nr:hypothetical protein [Streptosporangiaceae bacterium]